MTFLHKRFFSSMMTALNKVAPSPPLPLLRMMVVNNSDLTNKQLFFTKTIKHYPNHLDCYNGRSSFHYLAKIVPLVN